jgi:activating signal cointegrator 1
MKAITLTQPWATLVAIGAKQIETRSWTTTYRGQLAIHAAKGFPEYAQAVCLQEPFRTVLMEQTNIKIIWSRINKRTDFPLGAIVATCELVAIKPAHAISISDQECAFGDYSFGRYAWMFVNIQALPEPIPMRGMLGIWECSW